MIRLVAVGRMRSQALGAAVEEYRKRIGRFGRLEVEEVEASSPEEEGRRLLARARGHPVVACDPRGEPLDSEQLAALLARHGGPCFLVGGADGLSDDVRRRADRLLRLSDLTFPHELARLVLVEQLYRGLAFNHGHPYPR